MSDNHQLHEAVIALVPPQVSNDGEPTLEVKLAILYQERAQWRNTRYQMEIRYKISKRVSDENLRQSVETELAKIEGALDVLDEEIKALE